MIPSSTKNRTQPPNELNSTFPPLSSKLVLAIVTIFFLVSAISNNSKLAVDPVLVVILATVGRSVIL